MSAPESVQIDLRDITTLWSAAVTLRAYAATSVACGNAAGQATERLADEVWTLAQKLSRQPLSSHA